MCGCGRGICFEAARALGTPRVRRHVEGVINVAYGNAMVMYSPLPNLSESIHHMPKTAKDMVRCYER